MTLAHTLFVSLSRNHSPKKEIENAMRVVGRQVLLFVSLLLCIYNPSLLRTSSTSLNISLIYLLNNICLMFCYTN
jgi:hypothetical protein